MTFQEREQALARYEIELHLRARESALRLIAATAGHRTRTEDDDARPQPASGSAPRKDAT